MRITYDREVDALYFRFRDTTVTTKHLGDGAPARSSPVPLHDEAQHPDRDGHDRSHSPPPCAVIWAHQLGGTQQNECQKWISVEESLRNTSLTVDNASEIGGLCGLGG